MNSSIWKKNISINSFGNLTSYFLFFHVLVKKWVDIIPQASLCHSGCQHTWTGSQGFDMACVSVCLLPAEKRPFSVKSPGTTWGFPGRSQRRHLGHRDRRWTLWGHAWPSSPLSPVPLGQVSSLAPPELGVPDPAPCSHHPCPLPFLTQCVFCAVGKDSETGEQGVFKGQQGGHHG